MNLGDLIPITLFICITYAIKVVVDARVRRQMVTVGGSEELVRSVLQSEELRRRHSSLHWGVVLVALGIGFALIQAFGWQDLNAWARYAKWMFDNRLLTQPPAVGRAVTNDYLPGQGIDG